METGPAKKTLIVVAGPTAVGKTAMAIRLARHYQTEVISADSRQFYREVIIGTAKPDAVELAEVPHHFINSHSITDSFNVGDFEVQGLAVLSDIFKTHDVAVMAGGSGLYIKAICEGFDDLPVVDENIRYGLNAAYQQHGLSYLQQKLQAVDPDYYQHVDLNNPQRMIRAIEVFESSGKPFSSYRTAKNRQRDFNIIKTALTLPREQLYQRINQRVDVMMGQGLLQEVEALLPHRNSNALNTVGYKELFEYFDGKTGLAEAVALIKQNTRHFAKRQLTWFNKDKGFEWFLPDDFNRILAWIDSRK